MNIEKKKAQDLMSMRTWLINNVISDSGLNADVFKVSEQLFEVDYSYWNSLFEALVHCPTRASFSSVELKDSVFNACSTLGLIKQCYFFGASYHDNAYCSEVIEHFNYEIESFSRLYSYLIDSKAIQGGSTYSGLVSEDRQWMIVMSLDGDCASEFRITVYGADEFCRFISGFFSNKRHY